MNRALVQSHVVALLAIGLTGCHEPRTAGDALEQVHVVEDRFVPSAPEPFVQGGIFCPNVAFRDARFGVDSFELSEETGRTLDRIAASMKSAAAIKVVIEGHGDERGTARYNLALGERRARAALRYLVDQGIDHSRLRVVSYGKGMPLDPRQVEEAWARNRRVHFVAVSDFDDYRGDRVASSTGER